MATNLVTGIAGGLAQRVAERLIDAGDEVVGVDYRDIPPLEGKLAAVRFHRASYDKTAIEDVFRRHAFDRVLHLGRVGNLREGVTRRFDLNVVGSQKIMDLAVRHRARRVVVLSTFHIYGASNANHIPIAEDEPLRAGTSFPELADAIQLDNMATTWVWQHREVPVAVLRPTNVVGPRIHNTMSNVLRLERIPHVAGFDPMTQFIHEDDLADAVVRAAQSDAPGVFNLAGPDCVPWCTAIELVRARTIPVPGFLASALLRAVGSLPGYLVNFFRYPCVISDARFREAFDWAPKTPLRDALWSTVAETRINE